MFRPLLARLALGPRGERAARRHLLRCGYSIIGRNMRLAGVEADLVALDPDGRTLVIAEVKTLRNARRDPLERVDRQKRRRLERFARCLLGQHRFRGFAARFDLLAVHAQWHGMTVSHLPDAWREGE